MEDTKLKKVKKRIIKKKKVIISSDEPVNEKNDENESLSLEGKYLLTLTDEEKETLQIAKEHLKSSFSMEKSVGFIKWKNNQKKYLKEFCIYRMI